MCSFPLWTLLAHCSALGGPGHHCITEHCTGPTRHSLCPSTQVYLCSIPGMEMSKVMQFNTCPEALLQGTKEQRSQKHRHTWHRVPLGLTLWSHFDWKWWHKEHVMRVHCSIHGASLGTARGGAGPGESAGAVGDHCHNLHTARPRPALAHPLSVVGGGVGWHTFGHGYSSYGTLGYPCPPTAALPRHCCWVPCCLPGLALIASHLPNNANLIISTKLRVPIGQRQISRTVL